MCACMLLGRFSDGRSIDDEEWKIDGNEQKIEDDKRKKDGVDGPKDDDYIDYAAQIPGIFRYQLMRG